MSVFTQNVRGPVPLVLKMLGKRRRLPRAPLPLTMIPIERVFRSDLLAMMATIKGLVDERLVKKLGWIERQVPGIKTDADWSEEVRHVFDNIDEAAQVPIGLAVKMAKLRGREAASRNMQSVRHQMRSVLGVDVFFNDPTLTSQLNGFAAENVGLITSIPDRYLHEVEGSVLRNFRAGRRAETIQEEIEERYDVSKSRAALIARDQIGKLNGDLTRDRQASLGIKKYTWSTSQDERVRESHQALEGQTFDWDDPPEPGHPGQDYQCRCSALPVIEDLWE